MMRQRAPLSIVVPTLNEEARLPRLLSELRTVGDDIEIVVSDGGSIDSTVLLARSSADLVVEGPPGRGQQLNRGAAAASAPILFFVHADSRFDADAREALRTWLTDERSREQAATFRFALDADGSGWRILEWGQTWRQRLFGVAFGDQGLVVPRAVFGRAGGYPDIPIMEDAALMKTLRKNTSVHTLPARLPTSARRYRRQGRIKSVVRNQLLLGLFTIGVPPNRFARWYQPDPDPEERPARSPGTLLVFAKAPVPGQVKTRLAADVGGEAAARLYRALAERVLSQVRSAAYTTVVCFAPHEAEPQMRAWLGEESEYRAQSEGDLGDRMNEALAWALGRGGPACVVGTDAPDVDGALVEMAFAALHSHDVVIGPAEDGGYYLLGLNSPCPELFRGISWSTGIVLAATLEAAAAADLRTYLLPVLVDVDRLDDVPVELRGALLP